MQRTDLLDKQFSTSNRSRRYISQGSEKFEMEYESLAQMDKSKKDKKHRKRMKAVYSKVRAQMDFYFCDSNLHRDRFMKKQIESAENGYMELSMFMKFNRIRSLVDNVEDLKKALKKSTTLQVSEDGLKVKRTTPIADPKDIDERTVYVECLPVDVNQEWIRKIFSPCGNISHISLPKYKSTGENKRFGFIEFDSVEAAEKACEDLHNPPAYLGEKPTKFPKSNKQMDQLKKKLVCKEDNVEPAPEITSNNKVIPTLELPPADNERRKRKRKHLSGSSVDGSDDKSCSDQLLSPPDNTFRKRHRRISESSIDGEYVTAKHKRLDSGNSDQLDSTTDKSEQTESHSEKPKSESGSAKKKKKKRRSRSSLEKSQEESDNEAGDDKKDKKRKRQSLESVENMVPPNKIPKMSDILESTKNKRKCRKRKKQKEKEVPEIKVIPKKEWLMYRQEYLTLQKQSMSQLKKKLKSIEKMKKEKPREEKGMECHVEPRTGIEFVPDVIIKVQSTDQMERKQLKEFIGSEIEIAYIDVIEGSKTGVVRCKNAESASKLSDVISSKYKFSQVKGDDEKIYWDKLAADREAKLNKKNPHKKKGTQKLIAKAQKVSLNSQGGNMHIKFDDDD